MEKKGQSEVLTTTLIFELVIGVLIATVLVYAVLSINDTSQFSQSYLQQDLFLVKEMARSLPGDLEMKYYTGSWCLADGESFVKGTNCWVQITKTGDDVTIIKTEVKP